MTKTLPPTPHACDFYKMLFLKENEKDGQSQAAYVLSNDLEAMISKLVDQRLRDHGYTTAERSEIAKDMSFLRSKRLLVEHLAKQMVTLLVRGLFVAIGAIAVLGFREYIGL